MASLAAPSQKTVRPPPLYAFALPPALLADLRPRQLHIPESHPLYQSSSRTLVVPDLAAQGPLPPPLPSHLAIGGAFTCALTGASFEDLASLREHYKTDWYKYNVKLRMQGKPTGVTEEEFNALVDGLTDSISGSDSESADESEASTSSSTNAVSRLLQKHHVSHPAGATLESDGLEDLSGPRSAVIWYEAPSVAPGTQYGIYRAVLPVGGAGKKRPEGPEILDELRDLQLPQSGAPTKPRQWTLLMFGGGHFAGMVVSLVPKMVSAGKGKEKEREVVVLKKKTFHRYTTRRKQGGAQSANDSGKGKANSAGAQIRRHNESALSEEVQELLASWKTEIDDSELVFLRASKTNYKTFFGYDESPIDKKDPRIRGFSFPTKRPTINELLRAFAELTRVKASHLSAEALAQLDAEYLASITPAPAPALPPPKQILPKPVVPKLSRAEELERDRWTRAVDMTRKGKVDVLASFLNKYGPELEDARNTVWGTLPSWMEESKTMPTLLHVAAAADQPEMVRWLLVEKRADPTLEASVRPADLEASATGLIKPNLTPYEMAASRATRNVFRLLTTAHPDWWDWTGNGPTGARVPSGLTEEKEDELDQKTRERRGKLRDKLKEREKEREAKEAVEREAAEKERKAREDAEAAELLRTKKNKVVPSGPQRLGGAPPRAILNRQMDTAALTPEQRMRVEREQRARAAEARLAGRG